MRARALLSILGVVLAWGLATLTLLRFDTGAAYPPYSSFRPDPLGTKALHAALAGIGSTGGSTGESPAVSRSFEPLDDLAAGPGTTVIVAGASPEDFGDPAAPVWRSLIALASDGARVVLAFAPGNRAAATETPEPTEQEPGSEPHPAPAAAGPTPVLAATALEEDDDGRPLPEVATRTGGAESLPATLACRTSLWFDRLDDGWRVVYRRADLPVLIERRFGAGSLILVADAFPLSNEGVRFARESRLLAWLLGAPRQVIFDETHLGVTAPAGTMALVRRYRLRPVLATLVALALLFAWRAATPLLPAPAAAADRGEASAAISGRDAAAGIAGLLRRGLPPRQLLPAAVETWRLAGGGTPGAAPGTAAATTSGTSGASGALGAALATLAERPGDPVATYRRIRATLLPTQHSRHQSQPSPKSKPSQPGGEP